MFQGESLKQHMTPQKEAQRCNTTKKKSQYYMKKVETVKWKKM